MTRNPLSAARTPFIRLLLPLLVGIVGQAQLHLPLWSCLLPGLGGLVLWGLLTKRGTIEEQYRKREFFGWGLFLIFLSAGATLHHLQHRPYRMPDGFYPVAVAHIDHEAAEKEGAYYCPASITGLVDTLGHTVPYREKVALYFEKSLSAGRLDYGDRVVFEFRLRPIAGVGNPDDFDRAAFMRYQGIARSQYLADGRWRCIGHEPRSELRAWAAGQQAALAHRIDTCHLAPHSALLLKTLLLGDRADFPPDLRQSFSASGLSHILAVSGLHMGVIASLVYLLLFPLAWSETGRKLRPLLTLLVVWIYACVTGLSPSAVRASIMASFLLTAEFLERRNSSLNALFAAAFFMLLYDTRLVFDAGFQMSFAAVAAILLFYRRLNIGGRSPHRLVRWVSSCTAISIAAQAGALPIAIYYFHTLPLLFLVGNLVVLPLLPVIFGLALLMLLLTALHLPYVWIADATDLLLRFIEWLSLAIDRLPGSHIEGIWLEPRYLWGYFIGGILIYLTVKRRSKRLLGLTLGAAILFLAADLANHRPLRPEVIVYEDRQSTVVQLSDRERCYLLRPDTLPPAQPLPGEPYRQRNGHANHTLIQPGALPVEGTQLLIDYPFVLFHGKRLLLLDSTGWKSTDIRLPGKRLSIDYVVVDRLFDGRLADVTRLFDIGQVIIGANVHPSRAHLWLNDCYKQGIACHDVRTEGAWTYRPAR